ncbi:type III secretion system cytoplasmic ring protein SctQ [Chelativorans sp. YIM 93263]|uniref:type III secretion system cytoplasmic ring protein SctQ n=1 Tax=Chelativorans sp. YIM 93263 TaxID=2906648 RepID=UPI002379B1E7|nr:type III secretion system cytoplasmic ring protein SctQ [Chelativorans sp. YIM 93263]
MAQGTAEKPKKRRASSAKRVRESASPVKLREIALPRMRAFNQLYRWRAPSKLTIFGERVLVSAVWPPSDDGVARGTVTFAIDKSRGRLAVPLTAIDEWIAKFDPDADLARLAPDHAALLLECLLEDEIGQLEQYFDCRIALLSVDRAPATAREYPYAFKFVRGTEESECLLDLEDGWAIRLGRALNEMQRKTRSPRLDIPVSASIWRGAISLPFAELRGLQPGDVIVPDEINPAEDVAVAIFANRFAAPVRATEDGWLLTARPSSVAATKWEWIMDQSKRSDAAAIEDSELEELPLTVAFEIGRVGMSLKEISQLTPGAVVRVTDVPDQTVDLLANGKRIGRGEIVRVGEGLGVQVTRIFGDA